jgi:hypothetical protein
MTQHVLLPRHKTTMCFRHHHHHHTDTLPESAILKLTDQYCSTDANQSNSSKPNLIIHIQMKNPPLSCTPNPLAETNRAYHSAPFNKQKTETAFTVTIWLTR